MPGIAAHLINPAAVIAFGFFLIDFTLHLMLKKYRTLTKCLLMPLLIAVYCLQALNINLLVVLSLSAAWLGDLSLTWKDRPFWFNAGLISFLTGHILYTAVFIQTANGLSHLPAWFWALIIPYIMLAAILFFYLRHDLDGKRIEFCLYFGSIVFMSLSALARLFYLAGLASWLPFAGSLLFIASDSMLACDQFHAKLKKGDLLIMSTYACAQVLIVIGLLF